MSSIHAVTLEVDDPTRAETFYAAVLGPDSPVRVRASQAPTTGFRGFSLSPVVPRPADVDHLVDAARDAGATVVRSPERSLWGYGGVFRAPDGTVWNVATPAKKDTGPATGRIDDLVLLLGVDDVAASKRFYVDRGLAVGRSYGRRYVEFEAEQGPVKLALYRRKALAKTVGVPPDGGGSHRLAIASDAGPFRDPDGFAWEATASVRGGSRDAAAG